MSNSAHTKRVLCACTSMGCREQTVEISGAIRTGKLVSSSTRSRHLAKDRLLAVTDDCEEDEGGAVDDRGELGGAPTINDFRQSLLLVVSALAAWLHTRSLVWPWSLDSYWLEWKWKPLFPYPRMFAPLCRTYPSNRI
ncbi:hypothetical protein CPC08DRAFT_824669 [Agrocybe pediades]|nr:hypothetical protein CPC08DRAFT_824669 [Agrocybe pediades]